MNSTWQKEAKLLAVDGGVEKLNVERWTFFECWLCMVCLIRDVCGHLVDVESFPESMGKTAGNA